MQRLAEHDLKPCAAQAPDPINGIWRRVPAFCLQWGFLPSLLFVSLALRLWSITRIDMLSRDGYFYCILARKISDGFWLTAAADWFVFNPYPPLIALLTRFTGISFELSGQLLCAVPAGLAVLPFYFWTRSAFGVRVAQLTAWMYAMHPILVRSSADVMREGLYWFLMLTAVWVFWEAVQRASWILYLLGGILATAATLTRIEGVALFPLVLLWSAWKVEPSQVKRWLQWPCFRTGWRWSGAALACASFPALLLTLNLTLLPPGKPLLGFGRFSHIAHLLVSTLTNVPPSPRPVVIAQKQQAASSARATVTPISYTVAATPLPTTVRQLAKSLPVWNSEGVADPDQYRLQRMLILADDHREAIYIGHFLIRLTQGILIPIVVWFGIGLATARSNWKSARDWPLCLVSIFLVGFFFFHLATEHVLEARYLFCLIPFLFPWTSIGVLQTAGKIRAALERRGRVKYHPPLMATICLLLFAASVVHSAPRNDFGKTQQKALGAMLHDAPEKPLIMAGLESLRRIGYYADAEFRMLPQQPEEAYEWLKGQPVKYVILGGKERNKTLPLEEMFAKDPRYQRVNVDSLAFPDYQVYRVVQ